MVEDGGDDVGGSVVGGEMGRDDARWGYLEPGIKVMECIEDDVQWSCVG